MKKRNLLQSLNDAVEGFIYVVSQERNMRIHYLIGFLALILAIFLGVRPVEWMILCLTIAFVLVMEMINTAIEETVDVIFKNTHSQEARTIKHISAGAVLVASVTALVIGFLIFSRYWGWPLEAAVLRVRYSSWHKTFVSVLVVFFLVIAAKAFFKKGTPFKGGAVSGHSAIAFSLWTAILFKTENMFVVGVAFCMAALVAQSRIRAKIHSIWETLIGAMLGIVVTALFFKFFP